MSKQYAIAPKYILISSPSLKTQHNKKPLKKTSLPAKNEREIDKNNSISYQDNKLFMKKQNLKSYTKQATKSMESIRGDLNDCMGAIMQQSKKNRVLEELIELLSSQMQAAQQTQKQVKEVQLQQNLKRAQKLEYDIEQILQKHNQQVARINTLKEQVSSARSDRVVFSNLFRKLEKEIKHSEEEYRTLTIRTEINRQKKAEREDKQHQLNQQISLDEIEPRDKEEPKKNQSKSNSPECKFFLTIPQEKTASHNNKKNSYIAPQQECSSKRLKYLIESVETKIQKLAKTSQCSTCGQAVEYYRSIEAQNNQLTGLIFQEDRKIETIEGEIARIKQERRISEVYQSRHIGKLENLASTRKIRSFKNIKTTVTEQSEKYDEDIEVLSAIFDILGITHDKSVDLLVSSEETMAVLSTKIQSLFNPKAFKKSSSNISNSSGMEHDLQNLLSKMQKFDYCDRILNRKQFYTEYVKQVSKNKRSFRSRK